MKFTQNKAHIVSNCVIVHKVTTSYNIYSWEFQICLWLWLLLLLFVLVCISWNILKLFQSLHFCIFSLHLSNWHCPDTFVLISSFLHQATTPCSGWECSWHPVMSASLSGSVSFRQRCPAFTAFNRRCEKKKPLTFTQQLLSGLH